MATWVEAIRHGVEVAGLEEAPDPLAAAPHAGNGRGAPRDLAHGKRFTLTEASEAAARLYGIYEPPDPEGVWRSRDLDTSSLDKLPAWRLMDILIDISPELSSAVWTFCRSTNPGWEVTVHSGPGGTSPRLRASEEAVTRFLMTLKGLYSSVDIPINRLYIGAFVRGAFYGELILRDKNEPIDLATPDPVKARYRKIIDPERGQVWQLGQWVRGQFVPLDSYPTIRYVPVDPAPDNPYGRPMGSSALFTCLFLIGLMHDLRRVIAQQGYPRIDIEILIDELRKTIPEDDQEDPQVFLEHAGRAMTNIINAYTALQPDDAFVHLSSVKVNRPVGTIDVNAMGGIGSIINALERQVVRALKSMALLLVVQEGTAEVQANRQYEIYVAGIKSIQHLCESLLEHLLGEALRAQGLQGFVRFRFAELRASELLRDAQTLQLQVLNAWNSYVYGWCSQDEAAQLALGRRTADQDEPRYLPSSLTTPGTLAAAEDAATNPPAAAAVPALKPAPAPAAPTPDQQGDTRFASFMRTARAFVRGVPPR